MVTVSSDHEAQKIIFFDGVCSLCNGFIDFLIRRDQKRIFSYAPLQGSTALERLPMSKIKSTGPEGSNFTSIVLLDNGVMLTQSDAVLSIVSQLGGVWSLAPLLRIFPRIVRDSFYSLIARNRYAWFGKRDSCRLPTKEERQLFLD